MPEGRSGPPLSTNGGPEQPLNVQFGQTLEPVLIEACNQRLDHLHWFRADWQRGGALTGYATWRQPDHEPTPVVVKLPVPPQEMHWLRRLQPTPQRDAEIVPRLYAGGVELGGYDLAWVVMERLSHGPLDSHWQGAEWELLIDALGRFYVAAEEQPVDRPPRNEDWPAIIRRAREHLRRQDGLSEQQHWNTALKRLGKKLKKLLKEWDARDTEHWCHGDIHLANAMTRVEPPDGPALLFDFAEVHAGHWVEDAVYLEHLFWAHPQRLTNHDLVRMIAQARKKYGVKLEPQWPRLVDIRRALIAASAPAYPRTLHDSIHMHASLAVLEQAMQRLHL